MVTIYVIQGIATLKLYVGITDNLERRLMEHNAKKSRYTSSFVPWKVE
jgi:predicted GIY-YIG superfamily endonuclease